MRESENISWVNCKCICFRPVRRLCTVDHTKPARRCQQNCDWTRGRMLSAWAFYTRKHSVIRVLLSCFEINWKYLHPIQLKETNLSTSPHYLSYKYAYWNWMVALTLLQHHTYLPKYLYIFTLLFFISPLQVSASNCKTFLHYLQLSLKSTT